jgi:muramoyltetrapeptide carboxypeptidase
MRALNRPRPIERGTVGVFAPSSPFPEDRFDRGIGILRGLGLSPVLDPRIRARQGYLAGPDAERVALIHQLLDDPEVEVLWAARGGFGLHRILEQLDLERLRRAGKPIVGFSDIAALHALAQAKAELISIHGPVITQLGDLGADDHAALMRLLGGEREISLEASGPVIGSGRARGKVIGGCMSVLAPLIGTPYLPPLDGVILLLEDVGEASYRIDRLLCHLTLAGVFKKVAAVALGDFVGCLPRSPDEPDVLAVLEERLGGLGIPVLAGLPIGHGKRNRAIPLGAVATLDADKRLLEFER